MPMHDWTRVEPTIYHHFHQQWTAEIFKLLNARLLPPGLSALIEQSTRGVEPDVLTVERRRPNRPRPSGTATLPRTRLTVEAVDQLVRKANRVAIRHRLGEVVCIIEVVSPGNKSGRAALRAFVDKTHEFLTAGVNVLVIDLFPPTPRDPHGIHKAIWDEIEDVPFELTPDQPLTLAAYVAGDPTAGRAVTAYVEPVGVGAALPAMPAYLDSRYHVPVPLEATYQAAWETCPADMRYLVEHGRLPDEG